MVVNATSAKQIPVCLLMISLDDFVILASRGVCPYKARQIASRRVDFPAPVGPVMAKRLFSAKAGLVKSIVHVPLRELRF